MTTRALMYIHHTITHNIQMANKTLHKVLGLVHKQNTTKVIGPTIRVLHRLSHLHYDGLQKYRLCSHMIMSILFTVTFILSNYLFLRI